MLELITPRWPAPAHVKAYTTTRIGGNSQPPYHEFNLADHVGDQIATVMANRQYLLNFLNLPTQPSWLKQIHSHQIVNLSKPNALRTGDAAFTTAEKTICVVLTADCLPVLFCNRAGTWIAAAHAGWRGLAAGILEVTVQSYSQSPEDILAWLGPAIGPEAFEVGEEVRDAFLAKLPTTTLAFQATRQGHWLADLYQLARQILATQGVREIYGGEFCTYSDPTRFYSYRRDKITGRMASLIWLEQAKKNNPDRG